MVQASKEPLADLLKSLEESKDEAAAGTSKASKVLVKQVLQVLLYWQC